MSAPVRLLISTLLALIALSLSVPAAHASLLDASRQVNSWEFRWTDSSQIETIGQIIVSDEGWLSADSKQPFPGNPEGRNAAWLKIQLPDDMQAEWRQAALFIDKLYGHHVSVYTGERLIYESLRNYSYDVFKLALPLERSDLGSPVYIKMVTFSDRIGLHQPLQIADYFTGQKQFYTVDVLDLLLGGSLVFFALIMLICSWFLSKSQLSRWISLSLVFLTTGTMIVTYSPFLYTFGDSAKLFLLLFDFSLYLFLPSLTLFVEKVLDCQKRLFIAHLRRFIAGYSAFCIALLVLNELTMYRYAHVYYFFTLTVLGLIMVVLLLSLFGASVFYAYKGNKDAIILSAGFMVFAMTAAGELIWFFAQSKNYELHWWKWGVLGFLLAFIIILCRRFARDHEQIVHHSKELEMYNNRLQRHEKMEIISELAASVAHEVRNPLQVTRGFLQLLRETSDEKPRKYLGYALEELDRASEIITDFLTFAKPQLDHIAVLRLADEFEHIQGILAPMANLQGGDIHVQVPGDLFVSGNSSKLKQAFVNLIKNSIEALDGPGEISIWAYASNGAVVIHIKDTGSGMTPSELARLGEPYFSSKTKGTGLGLMVTYRIIEVMKGKIEFYSEKGVGTEAVVRFPQVAEPEPESDPSAAPTKTK